MENIVYNQLMFFSTFRWCSAVVLDIFTESDEAFCILLIENNAGDYAKMHCEQKN